MNQRRTKTTVPAAWLIASLALAALIAIVSVVAASTVDATNASDSGKHWRRYYYQQTVSLTLRNQIGPGAETQRINDTVASWGSLYASNPYPSGPARSDFGFAYEYGGSPSCNNSAPYRVVTFCVGASTGAGTTYSNYDSSKHIGYVYIIINASILYRYEKKVYCHEFGHALGVGHGWQDTCMYKKFYSWVGDVPKQHNLNVSTLASAGTHPVP